MQRCLQLAKLAKGNVAPNPMVGAVLVYNNKIIGEGYHQQFGRAHAEVNCINSVQAADKQCIQNSILYVSLEPCAHIGKTPPCTNLIITSKIPTVVIGCVDVFAAVNGLGIQQLQAAGIHVIINVLQQQCLAINKQFNYFHQYQQPYVILKWAQTADKKIAKNNFDAVAISNQFTNRLVHKWRSQNAAILVGTNTTLLDNPSLTTRHWQGNNPVRIIIDAHLKTPAHFNVLNKQAKTIVFNATKQAHGLHVNYIIIDFTKDILPQILQQLYILDIQSILVEGGAKLLQSFIDAGCWNEARIITNQQMYLHDGIAAPTLKNYLYKHQVEIEGDTICYFINQQKNDNYS